MYLATMVWPFNDASLQKVPTSVEPFSLLGSTNPQLSMSTEGPEG
jgi:hypothetical protein